MLTSEQMKTADLPVDRIAEICRRFEVRELSVFGSTARGEAGPDSDMDILVDFEPSARVGLLKLAHLSEELERIAHRKVDLVTKPGLKPWVRPQVLREAIVVYEK